MGEKVGIILNAHGICVSPGCSGEPSEVNPSKVRSIPPNRLSRVPPDFVTLCVKCTEGSIKEAAGAFGIRKVNNTQGSAKTQGHILLLISKLFQFAFPLAEGPTHCPQLTTNINYFLILSAFPSLQRFLLSRVACIIFQYEPLTSHTCLMWSNC